jgi:hypothetical protein
MIFGDVDPQYIQAPEIPLLWPPAGWWDTFRVGNFDRWIDIANYYGVGGWDLIEFNFGTRDEKVYNHCMKHLVGCTYTTDDRKRYSFYDAKPGVIFLPPKGWKPNGPAEIPAEEVALREEVRSLLVSPYLKAVRFQSPTLAQTTREMLSNVSSLIGKNKIRIRLDTSAAMHEYDPDDNVIILAVDDTSDVLIRGVIVHEAVHAAQDAQNRPRMAVNTECDAYIAQMIYLVRAGVIGPPPVWLPQVDVNDPDFATKVKRRNWEMKKGRAIYKEAWAIAERVIATDYPSRPGFPSPPPYERNPIWDNMPVVSQEDYDRLASAIVAHPRYSDSNSRFARLNGV